MSDVVVAEARATELALIRMLFEEYAGSIGFSLAFQGFEDELSSLPGRYARPSGRLLLARGAGYAAMRLDTVPSMRAAIALYESLGFRDIEPYTDNPVPGARFLELRL